MKVGMTKQEILDRFRDINEVYNDSSRYDSLSRMLDELLKEQEAVKPVPLEDEFGLYRCGKCYHQLFRCVDKYCSRCGRAVKWE